MKNIIFIIALLTSSFGFAEDTSFINFLGFSDDGRYMAFQEAILMDGSGGHYSMIRILDVEDDKYVDSQEKIIAEPEAEGVVLPAFTVWVEGAQNDAEAMLNNYGIKDSNGEVLHISVAPRISTMNYKGKYIGMILSKMAVNMENDPYIKADALKERFETCKAFSFDIAETSAYPAENSFLGYSVRAFGFDSYTSTQVLHEDKRVPFSRWCPYDYSLNSAFAFGDQVVVLVSYNNFGFEGPDTSFITMPFNIQYF